MHDEPFVDPPREVDVTRIEIEIRGEDAQAPETVLEVLELIVSQICGGFTSGHNSNEDSSYNYMVTETREPVKPS